MKLDCSASSGGESTRISDLQIDFRIHLRGNGYSCCGDDQVADP
jgi:hypothetical protein